MPAHARTAAIPEIASVQFADPIILTAHMIKRQNLESTASLTASEVRAEARREYERAAEIDPNYPRLLGHLANLELEESALIPFREEVGRFSPPSSIVFCLTI